jgi:cytochrome c556
MQRLMLVVCARVGMGAFVAVAVAAEDLVKIVKDRRELMDDTVRPAAKLGGDMIKGKILFDGAKAAKAMMEISEVPDKYVTMFPEGTEFGAIPDSEASPKIWEDFDGFKALAQKLKDKSLAAAAAAGTGESEFAVAFDTMTKVCKECHESYRKKKKKEN